MINENLPTLLVYTVNSAVCMTMGILFLSSQSLRRMLGRKYTFGNAKRLIGASSLLEALVSLVIAVRIYNDINFVSLNKFFVPMFFYFGLCLDVSAVLTLLHSNRLTRRTIFLSIAPMLLVWLLHVAFFVPQYGFTFSAEANTAYLESTAGRMTCWLLYALLAVEGIAFICYILGQSFRFVSRINNYFTGESRTKSWWLLWLTTSIAMYYILYAIDFLFFNSTVDIWITSVKTVFAMLNMIAFMNCRYIYWTILPAFDESLNINRNDNSTETAIEQNEIGDTMPAQPYRVIYDEKSPAEETTATELTSDSPSADSNQTSGQPVMPVAPSRSIDEIVDQWIKRDDRPYLRESITIVQVADEMNLNVRLLSKYINNVKGKNFNTWINEFKIMEVKRLLETKPQLSMSELAYEVGFTDSPAMSKIFKSMVGVPPSVYRQRLQQQQIDELKHKH